MKKLLGLSVAVALAAPLAAAANPTVYGRVNVNLVQEDMDTGESESWDVENNSSRIGVKGSEDLGNSLTAIYQLEFGVDASDSGELDGRLAYAGISGQFGTVAMGRQWTPYYGSVAKTDIMQIDTMDDHYLGLARVGNAVAYVTPTFNGLSGKAALVVDGDGTGEDTGEDFADWTNLSLDYENGPLSIGASWLRENTGEGDLFGLAGKFNVGRFAVIGQYENASEEIAEYTFFSDTALTRDDVTSWAVGGEAYFGNNTIRAVYGDVDAGAGGEYSNWSLGAEHMFSKRTRVYAEYEDSEHNKVSCGDSCVEYAEGQRFGVGIRHDF